MGFEPHHIYHVFNQGNNQQLIFQSENDYQTFLNYITKLLLPDCNMIAYSLLPNHFHFQLQAKDSCQKLIKQGGLRIDPLTNCIRKLLSGYARLFNAQYKQNGQFISSKNEIEMSYPGKQADYRLYVIRLLLHVFSLH